MKRNFKLSVQEFIFLFYIIMMTIGKGIGLTASDKLLQIISYLAFVMLGVKIIITKYKFSEIIKCILLILLGVAIYINSGRAGLFLSILTIIAIKGVSYEKILYCVFYTRIVSFILVISLELLGLVEKKEFFIWRGEGYILRYSLGFEHPNLLHNALFIIVILFIYLYYNKINIIHYILILIINTFIYSYSLSRTGYYCIVISVIITIVFKLFKEKVSYNIFKMIFWMCLIFTFFTMLYYNKIPLINELDKLLTGRIMSANIFMNQFKIGIFGNKLSGARYMLDNSYLSILYSYGLVAFSIFVFGYLKILNKFIKYKLEKELVFIILFIIGGLTEAFLSNIIMNISLIYFGEIIFKENNFGEKFYDKSCNNN